MSNITTRAGKSSRLTWNEVDANFNNLNSDKLDKVETADQTINSNIQLNKVTATSRFLSWLTGGVLRWKIESTNSAEAGSNAGSDLALKRYSDAGAVIDNPVSISRASGVVDFSQNPTVVGTALTTKTYVDTSDGNLQTQITANTNGKVAKAGDTMTGDLTLPNLNATNFVYFGSTNAGKGYAYSDANAAYYIGTKSVIFGGFGAGSYTALISANTERMRVASTGNVLIGATAEFAGAEKLQVTGSVNTSVDLKVGRRALLAGATDDGATALQVNGAVKVAGKITNLTAGAATGEGVEFAQLNNAISAAAVAVPRVQGFKANRRATNGQAIDMQVIRIQLTNPTNNNIVVINAPADQVCGIGSTGSGGKDSAASFANSWVYFYYIWGATSGLSTVCSLIAPPTGPTLPSGFTHWAFATAVKADNSGTPLLAIIRQEGSKVEYEQDQAYVINGGSATTPTAISLAAYAPSICRQVRLRCIMTATNSSVIQCNLSIGATSSYDRVVLTILTPTTSPAAYQSTYFNTPVDAAQTIYYRLTGGVPSSGGPIYANVSGYSVPNGDC